MDTNPQRQQMSDATMLKTLAAQVEAIWPQEREIIEAGRPPEAVLDVGCGPGEFLSRIAQIWPEAGLTGLDLDPEHLRRAAARVRGTFRVHDALEPVEGQWDRVFCRHVLQAVPHAPRVIEHLARACAPGGVVHLLAEDYGLLHFHPTSIDMDDFWRRTAIRYGELTGTDMRVGRRAPVLMREVGLQDVRTRWIVVDTERVSREIFAAILESWRDGYAEPVARACGLSLPWVLEGWEQMIHCVRDPGGYAAWHIPIVTGRRSR